MVDSTNPRVMADNIKMLAAGSGGSSVEANPEGAATEEITKLGIDGTVYEISDPVIYSTSERVIGKWVDGSTLYEKTYTGLNAAVAYNTWSNVVELEADTGILVDIEILSANTEKHNITGSGIEYYFDTDSHYLKAEYNQDVNKRNIGTITIRYTKTS